MCVCVCVCVHACVYVCATQVPQLACWTGYGGMNSVGVKDEQEGDGLRKGVKG